MAANAAGKPGNVVRFPESPDAPDEPVPGQAEAGQEVSRELILIGNPNVGKSVLFRNITGRQVNISNYPGTTVEIVSSRARIGGVDLELFDTPGINDLGQGTEDARVTREMVAARPGSRLVQVADAKNLRRALLLTLQLAELGRPMVLVLNMVDELERCGARIDVEGLSRILGIPVVTTIAVRNHGTDRLLGAIAEARVPDADGARVVTEGDACRRNSLRLERVNEILAATYRLEEPRRPSLGVRLGFWAMHPIKGLVMLAAVLFAIFWFVGLLGAGVAVDLLEVGVFQQRVGPWAIRAADAVLPFPHSHAVETVELTFGLPLTPAHEIPLAESARDVVVPAYQVDGSLGWFQESLRFVHDLLVGPYGLVTMALSYALAIVLPIVTTFFLLFSILEDSGYLPRLSIMVNRVFRVMGLSGKAVLPMILGLGCDTMAIMTTRILDSRRERIVTTVLLALTVPCSAQLGVLLAMMARLSFAAAAFWVALMAVLMVLVGWLTSRLFGHDRGGFILELPPMRRPLLGNVMSKTLARLEWYLWEVVPLFALGTAVLFLLDRLRLLGLIVSWGRPLVTGWLGLPEQTAEAFLIGFLRRDFGAVYLLDAATRPQPTLDPHQILVAMVTITLFMPCVATLFMIAKEHGRKVALAISAFIFPFAFLVGGLVHRVGLMIGI